MNPADSKTVYDQVIAVTCEYFGPAAERFVIRTIELHLGKNPTELTTEDIPQLLEWGRLAVALVEEDSNIVDGFSRDIMAIVDGRTETFA